MFNDGPVQHVLVCPHTIFDEDADDAKEFYHGESGHLCPMEKSGDAAIPPISLLQSLPSSRMAKMD